MTNAKLIDAAKAAWAADDGQSSLEDVVSAVIRRAGLEAGGVEYAAALSAMERELAEAPGVFPEDPKAEARRVAEREWDAAVNAAKRPTVVHDEDGGTSVEMRVPQGWKHDGCSTLGEFLWRKLPWMANDAAAALDAADRRAADFVAALPSMTEEQAKAAYWSLSREVRNAPAIRSLPKSVRRQF